GLAIGPFEDLVKDARTVWERSSRPRSARLIAARHFARWDPEDGLLNGRSELVVEVPVDGPAELLLSPWTPAIDLGGREPGGGVPGGGGPLGGLADGRTVIRIDTGEPPTIALRWQLRARPGSRGHGFSLGLPATEAASLELDLPDGWIPETSTGVRQEAPSGA